MQLTASAIKRILKAVGDECVPSDLDSAELGTDLEWARTYYQAGAKIRKKDAALNKKLVQLSKTAKRLKKLVGDNSVWHKIRRAYPLKMPYPDVILDALIEAEKISSQHPPQPEWLRRAAHDYATELGVFDRSSFEWLAGEHLPELFSKHFRAKATIRNAKGEADTPYVRFATAALADLGISHGGQAYAPESIVRAVTDVRAGRKRR